MLLNLNMSSERRMIYLEIIKMECRFNHPEDPHCFHLQPRPDCKMPKSRDKNKVNVCCKCGRTAAR